ncbi:MAG: DUF2959 domain-containing protein [Methylococcaceae bacterium]|nr:DUF2959 domain-containing protein [Methylococcaceae bacterium]
MADKKSSLMSGITESLSALIGHFFSQKVRDVYYRTRETFGDHKRDIVVYEVSQACVNLQDTRDQFEDALQRFKTIVCVDNTSLENKYNLLKRQYDFCQAKADHVSDRIRAIENVSEALFIEWEDELEQYANRGLRASSKQQLKISRQRYLRLIKTFNRAEEKMQPVLSAFKDQVLFLKHNLNAQAIAAVQHEFVEIGLDISQLIRVMEVIITEANEFIASLSDQKTLPAPK